MTDVAFFSRRLRCVRACGDVRNRAMSADETARTFATNEARRYLGPFRRVVFRFVLWGLGGGDLVAVRELR